MQKKPHGYCPCGKKQTEKNLALVVMLPVRDHPFPGVQTERKQDHLRAEEQHQKRRGPGDGGHAEERRDDQQDADQRGDKSGHRQDDLSEPFLRGKDAPDAGEDQPHAADDHEEHVEIQRISSFRHFT